MSGFVVSQTLTSEGPLVTEYKQVVGQQQAYNVSTGSTVPTTGQLWPRGNRGS